MTTDSAHVSWSKIWTFIGVMFIPFLSVTYFCTTGIQKLIDKVDTVIVKQGDQGQDIKDLKNDYKTLANRVDTISHRMELNQVKQDYRYQLDKATQGHPRVQWMEERYRSK